MTMEPNSHDLDSLFKQLGLAGSNESVQEFIRKNRPIPNNVELHQADFWTAAQASFLKEAIEEDADWAEVVDVLNVMMR